MMKHEPLNLAGVEGLAPNLASWRRVSLLALSLATFSSLRSCS